MKKILLIMMLVIILSFSACGDNDDKSKNASKNSSATSEKAENAEDIIEDVTENTNQAKTITEESGYSTNYNYDSTAKHSTTTKTEKTKATKKPEKTKTPKFELQIHYKNLTDFKNQVIKYKTFNDLMKNVDKEENAICLNPFRQENLVMIFDEKKAFAPLYPEGCKDEGCYLSSANYFCFKFSENGSANDIKIYTVNNNNNLKTDKFNLAFKNSYGFDIYKNHEGKYCWFLDDKYVVIYSGSSRDFINKIFFSQVYISY